MKKITKIEENKNVTDAKRKLRVAAYCRVSTDSNAQAESLEAQVTHYENYIAARNDWKCAGVYYDEGITGTKKEKRPELNRMLADCKAGKIDFIISKSISRFSRNTADCLELVRKLLNLNIPVYFEKESINTGSMESELFLSILSSMAADESLSISENSKWSVQRRFENATFKIGCPPYTAAITPSTAKLFMVCGIAKSTTAITIYGARVSNATSAVYADVVVHGRAAT